MIFMGGAYTHLNYARCLAMLLHWNKHALLRA